MVIFWITTDIQNLEYVKGWQLFTQLVTSETLVNEQLIRSNKKSMNEIICIMRHEE